jgi:hypothetical protein
VQNAGSHRDAGIEKKIQENMYSKRFVEIMLGNGDFLKKIKKQQG